MSHKDLSRRRNMKKLKLALSLFCAATMCLGLAACDPFNVAVTPGTSGNTSSDSSSSSNSSTGNHSSSSSSGGGSSSQTAPVEIPEDPITVTVRTETATITDSGRKSQKMDVVYISNYFSVRDAYSAGYTKLHVTVTFEAKEKDDGYQHVFLYYNTKCEGNTIVDQVIDQFYDPEDPSLLYHYKFEHGPGKKDTNWGNHSFSTTLNMSSLKTICISDMAHRGNGMIHGIIKISS